MLLKKLYDNLVAKVNSIDTSRFLLKTKYDTDKSEIENKITNTSDVVKKTDYNVKITEIDRKIPHVSSLATKSTLKLQLKIKYLILAIWLKKQIMILKLLKLNRNLLIIIMINIL